MASRRHNPFEGRLVQAPGMMRHGPFPALGPTSIHRSFDPLPADLLEKKIAVQASDMEQLAMENQRLAASQVSLRQEFTATQQEMQRVHARMSSIQTESDFQIRGLLDKVGKMEVDLRHGESLKKDLQEAHLEAKALVEARQELNDEIEKVTQELQKAHGDLKEMHEMHAELDSMRQDHQRLRASFEYEKGLNIEQVEQMQAMERNLISMAREVERLRAEVLNAEARARDIVTNSYGGTYGNSNPVYSYAGQGGYIDGYGGPQVQMSGGNPVVGQSGGSTGFVNGFGGPQVQMNGGIPVVGQGDLSGGYMDSYGGPQVQMNGGIPVVAHGGMPSSYVDGYGGPQASVSGVVPMVGQGDVSSGFVDGYGGSLPPMSGGVPVVGHGEGSSSFANGYGGPHAQTGSGVPVEGMSPYGGSSGVVVSSGWGGSNETVAVAPPG